MKHLRPSPAMLVALVALFVALGTGAYAATEIAKNSVGSVELKKDSVVSSRIRDGQVRGEDLRAESVTREKLVQGERVIWAVVKADGTLVRESGEITAASRVLTGRYSLKFSRPIANCAWVVSTSSDDTLSQAYAEVQRNGTATQELLVSTSRPEGGVSVLRDLDFQVIIACGTSAKDDK